MTTLNVLAIGAHPADVFDLAGGTLANFAADGHNVFLVSVTHGAYSHAQVLLSRDQQQVFAEVKAVKRNEFEEAAGHLGVKAVHCLELPDEPFIPTREAILNLGEYIRTTRPDVTLTHHPREYGHPDHPVVGEMALRALKAADRWLEGSALPRHPMKRVYFFGTQFRGMVAKLGAQVLAPDFVVDITRSIERKKKAVAAFRSQSFQGAHYSEAWAEERTQKIEGHWGFMNGVAFAEEFISLTPLVVTSLPA